MNTKGLQAYEMGETLIEKGVGPGMNIDRSLIPTRHSGFRRGQKRRLGVNHSMSELATLKSQGN